jgi:predicted metal-dependent enzyme (double-stranded beta helix superfamily)
MAYTLSQFCKDANAILKAHPQAEALPKVAERLGELLVNPQFVAETFNDDTPVGKRELFHDPELDFYVLAHVQEGGKIGRPHSHGTSWAIYGNAMNATEMTEYRRVNPETEENVVLEPSSNTRCVPARRAPTGRTSSTRPRIRRRRG